MISGPPGIGKTTAVRCLARSLGWNLIEQNASDLRNKKSLITGMGGVVNNQLLDFQRNKINAAKKFIILMDEVDGMSSGIFNCFYILFLFRSWWIQGPSKPNKKDKTANHLHCKRP